MAKARSELGCCSKTEPIVITLNQEEIANKKFSLEYSCTDDNYVRGHEVIKGWRTYANCSGSVQRKVEEDWKMAYLCRYDNEKEAEVSWSINLKDVKVKSFRLQVFGATTYENGAVTITLCAGDVCYPMRKGSNELVLDDVPSAIVKISAHLSGGAGDNAFQHAQLFRTPLDSPESQLKIDIDLE